MAKVEISADYCKSCSLCVDICPKKILEIGNKANRSGYFYAACQDQERCIGCAMCAVMCPDAAIEVYR